MYDKHDIDRMKECIPTKKFEKLANAFLDANIGPNQATGSFTEGQDVACDDFMKYLRSSEIDQILKENGLEEKFLLASMVATLKNSPAAELQDRKDSFIKDPNHTFTHNIPEAAALALKDLKASPREVAKAPNEEDKIPEAVKQTVRQAILQEMTKLDGKNIKRSVNVEPKTHNLGRVR